MKIPLLLPVMLCFSGLSSGADLAVSPVRPIREIQDATIVEPFEESLVSARGVVTWVEGGTGLGFYLQDNSGGLRVTLETGPVPKLGELVRVTGWLVRGDFAPLIRQGQYQSLGPSVLPKAKLTTAGGLLSGSYSGEQVLCKKPGVLCIGDGRGR